MDDNMLIKKENKSLNNDKKEKNNKKMVFYLLGLFMIMISVAGVTYAFFNYTRTGPTNTLSTGTIIFDYHNGNILNISNQFPLSETEVTNTNKLTFTITSHNTLTNGIDFSVYVVPGDEDNNRTKLLDSTMKMKFVPPANGDGFTITNNNYATATSPSYTNGEILVATGNVKGTTQETTKTYSLYLWLDSDAAFVSSTTKRQTLAEGNPSMAVATAGTVTADRYMKNSSELTNVKIFPANNDSTGKIIYTTNEFSNSYYSIKVKIVANNAIINS